MAKIKKVTESYLIGKHMAANGYSREDVMQWLFDAGYVMEGQAVVDVLQGWSDHQGE